MFLLRKQKPYKLFRQGAKDTDKSVLETHKMTPITIFMDNNLYKPQTKDMLDKYPLGNVTLYKSAYR